MLKVIEKRQEIKSIGNYLRRRCLNFIRTDAVAPSKMRKLCNREQE